MPTHKHNGVKNMHAAYVAYLIQACYWGVLFVGVVGMFTAIHSLIYPPADIQPE